MHLQSARVLVAVGDEELHVNGDDCCSSCPTCHEATNLRHHRSCATRGVIISRVNHMQVNMAAYANSNDMSFQDLTQFLQVVDNMYCMLESMGVPDTIRPESHP
jgi:hypothetical protein